MSLDYWPPTPRGWIGHTCPISPHFYAGRNSSSWRLNDLPEVVFAQAWSILPILSTTVVPCLWSLVPLQAFCMVPGHSI
jgi:hypothetical protein